MKPGDSFPQSVTPSDPVAAARTGARAPAPKRFYERAGAERDASGAYALTLDGRPARTPARRPLSVPTQNLAEALAAEWQAQGVEVDPRSMPLTRLVNSAIDAVAGRREAVIDDIVRYAGSDLVCYRAAEPERLVKAQGAAWDPILAWLREALRARFILSEGLTHVGQPASAVAAVRARVEAIDSPFRLAALHAMTTLTGSVLLALAHVEGRLGVEEAWAAAHVDETFQESVWGADEDATARRAARHEEFRTASRLFDLA